MGIVYKYGSLGACEKPGAIEHFLEGQSLRFASPSAQNDVNEAVPNVGRLLDRVMREAASKAYPQRASLNSTWIGMSEDEFLHKLYSHPTLGNANNIIAVRSAWQMSHSKFRRFGILSLTETRDNLLLWAHYASGESGAASGLCIGFDDSALVFRDSEYVAAGMRGIQEMTYSQTRASFSADSTEKRLAEIVLTKSVEWSYERELRCIRQLDEDGSPAYPRFEASDVREIILGSNMPPESIQRCAQLHAEKFPHAKLLLALPDPEYYKMLFYPLPDGRLLETVLRKPPSDISALGL